MRWTAEQDRALAQAAQGGGSMAQIAARVAPLLNLPITRDMVQKRLLRLGIKPLAARAADAPVPSLDFDGDQGVISTGAVEGPPASWDELLKIWGLDPEVFEILEPVAFRAWDAMVDGGTKRLFHYRARVQRRRAGEDRSDIDELIEQIKAHKPEMPTGITGGSAFVVALADLQVGKDEGGGTPALIDRFMSAIDEAKQRLYDLRTVGRDISSIYILGMGDLIEACSGHYAQQTFRVDLNHRDQMKVVRRLLLHAIRTFAPLADRVVVAAVGGNHGENRVNGKSYTNFADNEDVAVVEQISEILAENPEAYGHVEFVLPRGEDLTLLLVIAGTQVGLAHGHQFGSGASAGEKAVKWWEGQAFGSQTVAPAEILITAHFHHLIVRNTKGGKTHFQCPSLDGGSTWFTQTTGESSPAGVLSLVIGPNGWSDMQVLS